MYIGAHVSIAGGVQNAPENATKIGCECFQMFSRSPQGGPAPELTPRIVGKFKENLKHFHQNACYVHTPYYINLASSIDRIRHGSVDIIREELERGSLLGASYVMTHLGSAKDLGKAKAIKQVAQGIKKIMEGYTGSAQFLIELAAGAGMIIGDTFEEVRDIIKLSKSKKIGVCFDTVHCFASGYDLRTKTAVKKTFDEFDKIIGLKNLKLIHVNDAKAGLGSHIDRHEHIGQGEIGLKGFEALLNEPRLKDINLILETPKDGNRAGDVKVLKKLRG
ncbi:deoxyribonuclease IV [Patescibacteria group bacterium]|nr:deoxyribonuclease IV [Patescibacteria group bacterium]MBU1890054.1 deoxyribonuclease IV [Patescibacteria group bacterium]